MRVSSQEFRANDNVLQVGVFFVSIPVSRSELNVSGFVGCHLCTQILFLWPHLSSVVAEFMVCSCHIAQWMLARKCIQITTTMMKITIIIIKIHIWKIPWDSSCFVVPTIFHIRFLCCQLFRSADSRLYVLFSSNPQLMPAVVCHYLVNKYFFVICHYYRRYISFIRTKKSNILEGFRQHVSWQQDKIFAKAISSNSTLSRK